MRLLRSLAAGIWQSLKIDFAVRGAWQSRQADENGWHHVLWQTQGQCFAQRIHRTGFWRLVPYDVGDQALLATAALAHRHDAGADAGLHAERGLDLARFNAKAAYFHLLVTASAKFQISIRQQTHEIAGFVESFARGDR